MDSEEFKQTRRRDRPPIPQRGQRTLQAMPGQDSGDDMPARKAKKKRVRTTVNGVDNVEDLAVELGGLSSQRAPESSEPVHLQPGNDAHSQRRKKKKKASATGLEDDQADLVDRDGPDQTADGEEVVKKPKRKKKPKAVESQLPPELDVEEDDIITDAPSNIFQHSLFSAPQGQSQPVEKVFVERNKRFQAAERSDTRMTAEQTNNFIDFQSALPFWTTRDVSLRVHQGFRVLGLFCHGFLAGYAVWNVVLVYVLAGPQLTALRNLLQQYHSLAYPYQSLLYMLLAISTVAAFDRVNLAKGSLALREFITLDPVALASFLYFSALVLCLSQQMTCDRINLYQTSNGTLWPLGSEQQILQPWVTVNLVVALLVGLAWIFLSTRPEMDYTEAYLMAMEIEPFMPEDKPEISA